MKLTPIIAALRARCQLFENRVGGAAQFKAIPEAGKLAVLTRSMNCGLSLCLRAGRRQPARSPSQARQQMRGR